MRYVKLVVTMLVLATVLFLATHTYPRFYREGGKIHVNVTVEFCVPGLACPEAMG